MKIIGLAGTNGAGKDAVAKILVEEFGYVFAGATEMLAEELKKRGEPLDREHKSGLSAEWRREFGMGVIVDKGVALFEAAAGQPAGLAVGSLRHPGEADRVHELGGEMWWIDADPQIRYKRVQGANRGRDLEDKKTFEEFLAEEQREMAPTGDLATLNGAAVKEKSDRTIENNSDNIDDLKRLVREALGK